MKWYESKLKPSEGQDIIVRARSQDGSRWHYKIGVWLDGKFQAFIKSCDMCGDGRVKLIPVVWEPFQSSTVEWLPLSVYFGLEQRLEHAEK